MQFNIVSLFPDMFQALHNGIIGKAVKNNIIQLQVYNPRDFATDKHQSVDHMPYGGGPGMLMMTAPLQAAIQQAKKEIHTSHDKPPVVIYLSPQGKPFNQVAAQLLAKETSLVLVAGRYEGIDERIIEQEIDQEWSIGDYILSGGELAAMVMIDAISRLLPDVVGDSNSVTEDSLYNGLLKYPQYTRPQNFMGKKVPDVLLSGHHQQIAEWRLTQSLGRTWLKRPDLLKQRGLTESEAFLLTKFIKGLVNKK